VRKKASGTLALMRHGHSGANSKLRPHEDRLRHRLAENGELTLDELCCELSARGVEVHRSSVGSF
jgi:phosphohistidine phosphatase SixA